MPQETSKDELLGRVERAAHDYEAKYHGCSRSVLRAIQENLNLGDGLAFKASTPLAGGVAMRGNDCGALCGALMAIGMVTASEDITNEAALTEAMAAGFRFARRFEKAMGSVFCRDIQTARLGRFFDPADPTQYEAFEKAGGYKECPKVAGQAARMAAEYILELQERKKAKG